MEYTRTQALRGSGHASDDRNRLTKIMYEDFVAVETTSELKARMDRCYANNMAFRMIGSAWSWSKMIEARDGCINMILTGALSMTCEVDRERQRAHVAGGLQLCRFHSQTENLGLEWPVIGFCYDKRESQTFAGLISNNVHHSYTDTSYRWVEYIDIAVYVNGLASVVRASRTNHSQLFESIFGTAGFTGIIVFVGIILRHHEYFNVFNETFRLPLQGMPDTASLLMSQRCLIVWSMCTEECWIQTHQQVNAVDRPRGITSIKDSRPAKGLAFVLCIWLAAQKCGLQSQERSSVLLLTRMLNVQDGLGYALKSLPNPLNRKTLTSAPVSKDAVAIPDTSMDFSLFFRKKDYMKAVLSLQTCFRGAEHLPILFWFRLLPASGGGLVPFNSMDDSMCIEIQAVFCLHEIEIRIERYMQHLFEQGIGVQSHLGKSFLRKYAAVHNSLPAEIRSAIRGLKAEFDPRNLFDGGKVTFEDVYSLSVSEHVLV